MDQKIPKENQNQSQYDLCDLIEQYIRGEISSADTKRLQSLILNDPASRTFYVQYMRDAFNLSRMAEIHEQTVGNFDYSAEQIDQLMDDSPVQLAVEPVAKPTTLGVVVARMKNIGSYLTQPVPLSMIIASLTLGLSIMLLTQIYFNNQAPVVNPLVNESLALKKAKTIQVAEIVSLDHCIWDDETKPMQVGQGVYFNEVLGISKGWLELRLNRGAIVRLFNKSRIQLEGDNSVRLDYGKLAAIVPEGAKRLTVDTDFSHCVDLGTEFGVQASQNASTIHVRKGEVEVCPRRNGKVIESEKQLLASGDTIRISGSDSSIAKITKEKEFQWISYQPIKEFNQWAEHSAKLKSDPDIVAYYTFNRGNSRLGSLKNQAKTTSGDLDGQLGNSGNLMGSDRPRWDIGRWSSKGALRFDSHKKQIVAIKNFSKYQPRNEISVCAWVKAERDQGYRTIVSQWHDGLNQPGLFFYLALRNQANEYSGNNLVIRTRISNDGVNKTIPPLLGLNENQRVSRRSGWVHVVMTAKANGGPFRLYRNGKLIAEKTYPEKSFPKCNSDLFIGAMMDNNTVSGKEHFHGLVDELAIFKRTLTQTEIAEMYRVGNPAIE